MAKTREDEINELAEDFKVFVKDSLLMGGHDIEDSFEFLRVALETFTELNFDRKPTLQLVTNDEGKHEKTCTKCESPDWRSRYSLGIYAGRYCDKCWDTSGFRKDGAEGFDQDDAGESYDE